MARHGVPTAAYHACESADEAVAVLTSGRFGYPVVLKADGLAAGKGVVVAPDAATADAAVTAMMRERRFGDAGDAGGRSRSASTGPELSYFVLSDGERVVPLGSAQDHKRVFDGDRGPNTGGMGAFAPSPLCDAALERRILDEIVAPVIAGMRAEGHPYRGLPVLRPDAHALGPEGDRVQRAVRRSGSAGACCRSIEGDLARDAGGRRGRRPPGSRRASRRTPARSGVVLASADIPTRSRRASRSTGLDAGRARCRT